MAVRSRSRALAVRPATDSAIEPPKSRSLFACDRLSDAHVVARLLERPVATDPAELLDFEALEPAGSGLILLFASEGARAAGALYRKLSDEDFARLDAFQGALEGLTFRELGRVVPPGGDAAGGEEAWIYLPTERLAGRTFG